MLKDGKYTGSGNAPAGSALRRIKLSDLNTLDKAARYALARVGRWRCKCIPSLYPDRITRSYAEYRSVNHVNASNTNGSPRSNSVLGAVHRNLNGLMRRARFAANLSRPRWNQAMAEHEELLDGLVQRDARRVSELLHKHLANKYASIRDALEEEPEGPR